MVLLLLCDGGTARWLVYRFFGQKCYTYWILFIYLMSRFLVECNVDHDDVLGYK